MLLQIVLRNLRYRNRKKVFSKTIGETSGQLIFSQVGDTLKVESKNSEKSVSAKGNHWSVRVNGKEIFSFFETAKVEQVVQAFNKLPQKKKKGQRFEIVQNVYKTGWQEIGNKIYYFDDDRVMHTGELQLEGKIYHFPGNGEMK